ncbi:MAG: trigger factor [Deltaproteobacteria bacterium]|jgi:trigger factor|nr:trigger factor [Deltaproteobacteria bacterium]
MQSEIREISPVLVEVTVEVPWDRIQKDLNDTYKELGKTARVRGFRPGKVPRDVVKQMYGRQVAAQVTGTLVEQGLMEAVQKHELHIVAQPEMEEAPELEKGKPLTFKAKVEVRPKIDQVAIDELEAWQMPIDVPNADVDAEIESLQHQHAEIQVPDPMRPAKEGDLITIDYSVSIDGEVKEDLGAEGRQVEINDEHLLPALKEGLLGMQPGDDKTVDVEFEDDHPNETLRGKTAQFTITAKDLHEKLLPELDDEFAKDCGDYETLLELRLKIREDLEASAKRRAEAELKDQLIDSLIEHNDIPVPPSMVQQQQQMMMYEMAQFMQMAGQQGAPGADFFSGIEGRAKRRVQAGILLGSLARQENIEVTDADLDAKFQEIADRTGKHIAKVRADYQEAQRDALQSQLLEEKVMALLTERAKINEGERPEPEPKPQEDERDEAPAEDEGEDS